MFNLKKLITVVCGTMIAMSVTLISASAANEINIVSGGSFDAGSKLTSIKINISGLATSSSDTTDNFTTNSDMYIKVPKGVFAAVQPNPSTSASSVLHYENGAFKTPTVPNYNSAIDDSNADYDVIFFTYYGENACFTPNGDIVELQLLYASEPCEVKMEILEKSIIRIVNKNGETVLDDAPFAENKNTYTLAADSSTVTKTVAGEGSEEDANKVAFEGFTGTKEDGVTADGSVSVAAKKSFTTSEDGTSEILWTVTLNDEDNTKRYHTSTVDFAGGADYTLGMVINGLAESLVKTIEAVLQ